MKHYYIKLEARDAAVNGLNFLLTADIVSNTAEAAASAAVHLGETAAEIMFAEEAEEE